MVDLRAYPQLESLIKKVFDDVVDPSDYLKRSERGAANGVASLDGTTKIPTAEIPFNDAGATAADILSALEIDTRVTAAAIGLLDLKGDYNAATNTPDLDTTPIAGIKKGDFYVVTADGVFFTEQMRVLDQLIAKQDDPTLLIHWIRVERNIDLATETVAGLVELATDGESAPNVVVQGDDARMSDARTPLAHVHSADDITTGILAVVRGGTGVATSTGTGSVVLSASPTFTGIINAAAINTSGRVNVGASEAGVFTPQLGVYNAGNTFFIVRNTTGDVESYILSTASAGNFGTASNHPLEFSVNNIVKWSIATGGDLLAVPDNGPNIGASGANRPANIFWATQALGPNGSAGTPSVAAAGETTTGVFFTAGAINWSTVGTRRAELSAILFNLFPDSSGASLRLANNATLEFSSSGSVGTVFLSLGAANRLDLATGDSFVIQGGSLTVNEGAVSTGDLRVEGESLQRLLATDASAATENLIFCHNTAPDFKTMDRGIAIGNVSQAPTGNPVGGGFLYVVAGALTWRGSSGNVETIAIA